MIRAARPLTGGHVRPSGAAAGGSLQAMRCEVKIILILDVEQAPTDRQFGACSTLSVSRTA